jgi:preprotein translocase subunit YajC
MPLPACLAALAFPIPAAARVLLDDAGPGQGGSMLQMLGLPLGIGAIFLFMIILPERKEKKRKAAMLDELKKNDRVLTTFGMYATVAAVNEGDLTLKLDDGATRVRVLKSTIATVITPEGDAPAKEKG